MCIYIYIYIYIHTYTHDSGATGDAADSFMLSFKLQYLTLGVACHILPPSEIELGLCLAVSAGSGGKCLFHRIG